jgi:hypothetical protein
MMTDLDGAVCMPRSTRVQGEPPFRGGLPGGELVAQERLLFGLFPFQLFESAQHAKGCQVCPYYKDGGSFFSSVFLTADF